MPEKGSKPRRKYIERVSHSDPRRKLRKWPMFAVCNYGSVWNVFYYRRDALAFALKEFEEHRQADHRDWKDLFEIRKVTVTEVVR